MRHLWNTLLTKKIHDENDVDTAQLSHSLMQFFHTEVLYSVRRLLPGDLKIAFVGPKKNQNVEIDTNPFGEEIQFNEIKGGFQLNEFLNFNCLENSVEELSLLQEECEICQEKLYGSSLQLTCHYSKCFKFDQIEEQQDIIEHHKQNYLCRICGKNLILSTIEILRHAKSCEK